MPSIIIIYNQQSKIILEFNYQSDSEARFISEDQGISMIPYAQQNTRPNRISNHLSFLPS